MKTYSLDLGNGLYRCLLCPNACELRNKRRGKCRVRGVGDNGIELLSYGEITALSAEPIEKKPFYHFRPGTKVLSIGCEGCNLSCLYCANYKITQSACPPIRRLPLEKAISVAVLSGCQGICMTHNEPIPSYEYLIDLAEAAHKAGLYFVISTNGYVEKEPWADICNVVDAINIDYKAPSAEQYEKVTRASAGSPMYTVLTRLLEAINHGNHVEISVPVYPDITVKDYEHFRRFVSYHNAYIPVHLLSMIPDNEMINEISVPESLLFELREYLIEKLSFVYIQNVYSDEAKKTRQTICPRCTGLIVERDAFKITTHFEDGCGDCRSFFTLDK